MTSNVRRSILIYLACGVLAWTPALHGQAKPAPLPVAQEHDGQHDFDFEFGSWKTHLSRRLHPLTGSNTWVEYEGTSVVRRVWNGRANLGELDVDGSAGHIQGLSLRIYHPQSK